MAWRLGLIVLLLGGAMVLSQARAEEAAARPAKKPRVVYPKHTELDFEGLEIEGELQRPGEFYFEYREKERFGTLVERRKNFHREMLRDVVLSR